MIIKEKRKIDIQFNTEERDLTEKFVRLLRKLEDNLDAVGVFDDEYEETIENIIDGIVKIEDWTDVGIEKDFEEDN